MMDENGITVAIICFIAIASSLFMSISPLPFIWRILKNRDAEEFHPYPFIASHISHFFWLCYCFNENKNFRLITGCLFFCCMVELTFDVIYNLIFISCSSERRTFTMACIFPAVIAFLLFVFIPLCGNLNDRARKVFLGTLGVVSGTLMYLSPLSNITRVYKTKSSKYMPHVRCITMFLNSICWFTSNCIVGSIDPYIAITNGIGILSGIIILGILYKFRKTPRKSHELKLLEATLDVDPRKEIVVLNRICPRCNYIMFEKKEKIKFVPDTKYMLYQNEGSKRWRVNGVAKTGRIESYIGISDRFDKLSLECRNTLVPEASNQKDTIEDQV